MESFQTAKTNRRVTAISRQLVHFMAIFSLTSFLWLSNSWAQGIYDCRTASSYFTKKIVNLYNQNKLDSIAPYIQKWDESCESSEEIERLKILWAIKAGKLDEDTYSNQIIEHLIDYREKIRLEQNFPYLSDVEREYKKFIFSNRDFNRFTQSLAAGIAQGKHADGVALMFAEYYSNEFNAFFEKLRDPPNKRTELYSYYIYYLNNLRNGHERYITIVAGYWLPQGNIEFYSPHPGVGIALGYKVKEYAFQLTASVRLLDGENFLYFQSNQWNVSHFVRSVFVALDQRRDMIQTKNSEFNLGFGLGVEDFGVYLPSPHRPLDHLQSFVLSLGAGYKYYWTTNHSRFSEIQFIANRYGDGEYSIEFRIAYGFNMNKKEE